MSNGDLQQDIVALEQEIAALRLELEQAGVLGPRQVDLMTALINAAATAVIAMIGLAASPPTAGISFGLATAVIAGTGTTAALGTIAAPVAGDYFSSLVENGGLIPRLPEEQWHDVTPGPDIQYPTLFTTLYQDFSTIYFNRDVYDAMSSLDGETRDSVAALLQLLELYNKEILT